ncbi:MAG: hypothetical protein WC457_04315 [Patescibacteria group bacterium]
MTDEVLIPVKKLDGTVEKITMAEFQTRQKNKQRAKTAVVITQKPISPAQTVVIPAPTTPKTVINEKIKEEPALEELPKTTANAPRVSPDRKAEAGEIVRKLNLQISSDAKNRLLGLVQLRLKDVRGEEEVKEWLVRSENQYGIGLDAVAADKVIMAVNDFIKKNIPQSAEVPVLKKPLGVPKALLKEDQEPFPATSSPINSFVHRSTPEPQRGEGGLGSPKQKSEGGRKSLDDLVRAESVNMGNDISGLVAKREMPARTMVQDITPAKPANLGPVEEIRYFTLTDFRRLSTNPNEAASRLAQKFTNLRDESYILFMNALEAWRLSPLFNDYIGASAASLNMKKKVAENMADKNKIQMNEIKALIQMEKDLL